MSPAPVTAPFPEENRRLGSKVFRGPILYSASEDPSPRRGRAMPSRSSGIAAMVLAVMLLGGGGATGSSQRAVRAGSSGVGGVTLHLRGGEGGCLPSVGRLLGMLLGGSRSQSPSRGEMGGSGVELPRLQVPHSCSAPAELEPRLPSETGRGALRAETSEEEAAGRALESERLRPAYSGHTPRSSSPTPGDMPLQGEVGKSRPKPSRKGSGMLVENNNLPSEVMHGYEKGYAALQWNSDGTLAQGIVPIQYDSSHSSSSPPTSSFSSSSSSDLEDCETLPSGSPSPMRGWVKKSRRGDRRAERVGERWEREGFTTYVPISPCEAEAEDVLDEESIGQVALQWRATINKRHRLFNARVLGAAGVCTSQGRREAMEDAYSALPNDGLCHPAVLGGAWKLFGVYDGHGGARASHYCRDYLLSTVASFASAPAGSEVLTAEDMAQAMRSAFVKTDQHFVADAERHEWMDGTTVLVAGVSEDALVVANAGDSRAVMGVVRQGSVEGEEVVSAVAMSKDHRPRDPLELARIEAAGGIVVNRRGIARVMGVLAVARAIGDAQLKPYISPDPDVSVVARAEETWFVILATDGLWDVVSDKEAVELVLERMLDQSSEFRGARRLCHEAYTRGSTDNISVLVIDLRKRRYSSCGGGRDDEWESEGGLR